VAFPADPKTELHLRGPDLFSAPKPAPDVKQLLLTHQQGPEAASPSKTRKPIARIA
jgi:hypothetical protein